MLIDKCKGCGEDVGSIVPPGWECFAPELLSSHSGYCRDCCSASHDRSDKEMRSIVKSEVYVCSRCVNPYSHWKSDMFGYKRICDDCHESLKLLLLEWIDAGKSLSEEKARFLIQGDFAIDPSDDSPTERNGLDARDS